MDIAAAPPADPAPTRARPPALVAPGGQRHQVAFGASGDDPAVQVEGLTRCYGGVPVVDAVSFTVPSGAVTGFVGPNGAGKTTTLRMLLGLVTPDAGQVMVLGRPLRERDRFLPAVGAMLEGPAFHPGMSGRDNLRLLATLSGLPVSRVDECLALVGLSGRACQGYRTYSLGMKQRLGIAAALLGRPRLLVLDEPTNGLDPAGIVEVRALLRGLVDAGTSVLVSSHLLAEVQAVADHLVLLHQGRVRFTGTVAELLAGQAPAATVRPEHPGDLPRLAHALTAAGLATQPATEGALLVTGPIPTQHSPATLGMPPAGRCAPVQGAARWSAGVNRVAFAAGVVLAELTAHTGTLEEAFLAMTDTGDGQL